MSVTSATFKADLAGVDELLPLLPVDGLLPPQAVSSITNKVRREAAGTKLPNLRIKHPFLSNGEIDMIME